MKQQPLTFVSKVPIFTPIITSKAIDSKYQSFVAFFMDPRPVYLSKMRFMASLVNIYYQNSAVESRTTLRDMNSLVQLILLQKAVKTEKIVLEMLQSISPGFKETSFRTDADLSMVAPVFLPLLEKICVFRKSSFTLNWLVIDYVTVMHPLIIQMVSDFYLFIL